MWVWVASIVAMTMGMTMGLIMGMGIRGRREYFVDVARGEIDGRLKDIAEYSRVDE
jgi:hypothetical protein